MTTTTSSTQYDDFASHYGKMEDLPGEILATRGLRAELLSVDLKGKKVLDIGGGSGTYARLAVELGAACVTCVDISAAMVQQGKDIEASQTQQHGLASRIEYFTADCAAPLDHLPLVEKGFDIVMGNWVLCYAGTVAELEGMWRNIATYLAPRGRFVGLMNLDPLAQSMRVPKYGVSGTVSGTVKDGLRVHVTAHVDPLIEFDAFILERNFYEEVPVQCGMTEVTVSKLTEDVLPPDADLNYWQDFFKDPYFVIFKASAK